jgi:sugar diacid utilization regulator
MQEIPPSPPDLSDAALRHQLSSLLSVLVLSIRMTESRGERQILELATTSAPALVDCRAHGAFLESGGWLLTSASLVAPEVLADLEAQFAVLSNAGGAVSIQGDEWGWAFPLRSLAGDLGYLVVGADAEPPALDQFILRVLAQQAGVALANARLHERQLAASAELLAANARLTESVDTIRRRAEIHERLTRAAMAGAGLVGVAEAVYDLTGHATVIDDRFGNLIARAGPDEPGRRSPQPRGARDRLIQRVLEAHGPVRESGRIVVIAGSREQVDGFISLIDPDGTAGEPDVVALEHGATVVAMELSRLRSLGEQQLRLGRDLLEDLLAGADPQIAIERGRAIGCDLLQPRRVAIVEAVGSAADEERLFAAVRLAVRDHVVGWLLAMHEGTAVALVDSETDWIAFQSAVVRSLGGDCWVGVGGSGMGPADVRRSYREARLSIKVGEASGRGAGVSVFDDLGVFQLLGEIEQLASVEQFVRTWLGALLDYDARKPAELVPTLDRFLELGTAQQAASDALAIHRSTLKYRLQRIQDISRHDLSDPDTRFNLQLATRAWQTLVALRGTHGAGSGRADGPHGVSGSTAVTPPRVRDRPARDSAGSRGSALP